MSRRIALIAFALIIALIGLVLAAMSLIRPSETPVAGLSAAVRASNVYALSNKERSSEGVMQLSLNPLLMRAAQLKAEDMGKEAYYAHVSPDGETPMHWLDMVGYQYQYVGENLTANIMDEEDVVSAWMGSPGHRRNLLDPKFTHVGIGVAEGTYKGKPALFVVQMLATPKPVALPPSPKPVAASVPKPKAPLPTPAPKPIKVPEPKAATISDTKIVRDVQELTKPLTDPLQATTTTRIFSATSSEPIPFIISTSAIPVELRAEQSPEAAQLPEPEQMRTLGKEVSMSWVSRISSFMQGVTTQISSLIRI
jgi:hypothetical protein